MADATEEEIRAAVENAYLADFIDSIPEGLETRVGERGNLLSGGQKQRVAIARAFLKNAPVLLLDEATSALDSQSEEIVQKAVERLIEEGQIVEVGTHKELLKKQGRYYQLYSM